MSQRARARHRFASLLGSLLIVAGLLPVLALPVAAATPVFINEIHYDDDGDDIGEGIEIAGPAGTDLTSWSIVLYNGSGGTVYDTATLSGSILDAGSGFGTASVAYPVNGIQNGSPDGIALVNGTTVVQFLSYEGSFAAVGGPADGVVSTDIGVAEGSATLAGTSLSLVGTGTTYEDFTWQAGVDDSFGSPNVGQTFATAPPPSAVINEFSASTAGTDVEYVEVISSPGANLSSLTLLEIEGDAGAATGTIDEVISLGTTGPSGLFLVELPSNALENGTITLILVRGFSGAAGTDLDINGDGIFDATPWTAILDAVAVNDGGAGDLTYGVPSLGVAYDGQPFAPGGASRIPDGVDTDTAADWVRNDFDLFGITGVAGTPIVGEAINTPGAGNALVPLRNIVINELDSDTPGTDAAEFVELHDGGTGGTSLAGLVLVFYNGATDVSYLALDLDGQATDAGGYFVAGNTAVVPAPGITFAGNTLQNGQDAVALYVGNASDFPGGTPVTTANLIDAVVYDTDDADDPGLLQLLHLAQPQVNENGGGDGAGDSIGRCPNGEGGARNTASFLARNPTPGAANDCPQPDLPLGACGDDATLISAIQGAGLTSPLDGTQAVIEGIVVGDFQNNASADSGELNGYYVQEEDADADANPLTSEGLFVFHPSAPDVAIGDSVRVVGTIDEFGDGGPVTELTSVHGFALCAAGNPLPAATAVTLPVAAISDFEPVEGMYVTFPQSLVISEYFNYDRFGEIVLALPLGGQDRPFTGTAVAEPGAAANAVTLANSLRRITLDDGLTSQNPAITRHPNGDPFALDNRFRGGDTVANATGVLDHSFNLYRIHPTQGADYTSTNPRPAAPEDVGGSLQVAAMNTLNYFLTADYPSGDPLDNKCGPLQTLECRGWDFDQPTELTRQRTKLLQALGNLDADVIGLNEIENTLGVNPAADIAQGLTDLGFGPWAAITTGTIGTDAIKVGMIYRTDKVLPVGGFEILDSTVDPRFRDNLNRPVLAQTFEDVATGGRITVAVNHLKSKGSDCNDVGDPDIGDGQGNCNLTRELAAQALVDWLQTDPTGSGDRDYLIIGDLNSYAREDPIDAILAGPDDTSGTFDDYTNLIEAYLGEHAYSFVFDGQFGYLDHALSSPSLTAQVTGVTEWHINADEPDILDYDTSFKSETQDTFFEPNAYRTSDHDPVIVGLELKAFDFDGFSRPAVNPPAVNTWKAGATLPLRFTLGDEDDLDVLVAARVYTCAGHPSGSSVAAQTSDNLGLLFDAETGEYKYEWKTLKAWADSCRTLELILADGQYRTVHVDFTK